MNNELGEKALVELEDCPHCNGTGNVNCAFCNSMGMLGLYPLIFTSLPYCYTCGRIGRSLCTFCSGKGKRAKRN